MATPNESTGPNITEYGGDEVFAIVLDPGYSATRVGFAGNGEPDYHAPSHYLLKDNDRPIFDENAFDNIPMSHQVEVRNVINGGGVEDWIADWDVASKLWEHAITSRLTGPRNRRTTAIRSTGGRDIDEDGDSDVEMQNADDTAAHKRAEADEEGERGDGDPFSEHPLIMSDPGLSSKKIREKIITMAMEEWEVPAFYVAKTGALSAFAQGHFTALVVDLGASMASVTPVLDAMSLRKGIRTSTLAGNFITDQSRLLFQQQTPPVPLIPHYMVASKKPVEAGQPAQATYRDFAHPATDSFRKYHEDAILQDFKKSVVEFWPGPSKPGPDKDTNELDSPPRSFEMPNGSNRTYSVQDRRKVAEGIFDYKAALTDASNPAPTLEQTLPHLITSAIEAVDTDIRPALLANIVVVGKASLQSKFTQRLNTELQIMFPSPSIKMAAYAAPVQRGSSSWIGGSVITSVGSFHQMWISRKEYDEYGPSIVEKRSKN